MNNEIAKVAMQFLVRVHLTGQEVPAFNAVMSELSRLAEGGGSAQESEQEIQPTTP